jgi:hypothetical protein
MVQVATFSNMGVMCINGEIQGVCQNCLWLEWNPALKRCTNANTCFCPRADEEQMLISAFDRMVFSV